MKKLTTYSSILILFIILLACQNEGKRSANSSLLKKIDKMKKQRGPDYVPRTKHLTKDGKAKFTNRLFLESSPYLIQHAHNPVNWYPWGDEAFETAKRLKRPIIISVGYSTCHWCHVMEEESFEDLEIAKFMNDNYISVKIDREERPDVDAIYMSAIHAMGQNGGWPMTVWLTPERKPFFGGTYFPARDGDRGTHRGFLTVLKSLKKAYDTQKDKILQTSEGLTEAIKRNLKPLAGLSLPAAKIMDTAADYYKGAFDRKNGGIGNRNKFPSSVPVRFLLRYFKRTKDPEVLKLIKLSLSKMAGGGMYDHVGGGFHRYSTDPLWLVPHFEKMLYDNALLSSVYLEAYQVTGDKNFLRVTNEILSYVEKDMTSPEGAFYSATDADSLNHLGHREEGYFFTWTQNELKEILDKKHYEVIKKYYAVTTAGNFENRHILNAPRKREVVAKELKISVIELNKIIDESRIILYDHRKLRPAPIRDEKILVAWNGLMISSYAYAGLILKNKNYIGRAIKSADFILKNLYKKGRLFRSYKDGMAKHNAYLSDYAFLIAGLLDLFEATFDSRWLLQAIQLDKTLEGFYEDKENGGFYMTSSDHEKLLAREKPGYDGAEPTGNSIHALNLLRLGELTSKEKYNKRAVKTLKSFSTTLAGSPRALTEMLLAVDFYYDKAKEVVIITREGEEKSAENLLDTFRKVFLPNRILTVVAEGAKISNLAKIIPLIEAKVSIKRKATVYVCEEGICELPTSNPTILLKQLQK